MPKDHFRLTRKSRNFTEESIRVAGFDTSSRTTGWAVVEWRGPDEEPTVLGLGAFELKQGSSNSERLHEFRQHVIHVVDQHKPTRVAVEQVFVRFLQTAVVLAKFVAIVEQYAVEATGVPAILATANKVRRMIGSKDKEETLRIVNEKFGVQIPENELDISDALALAWVSMGVGRSLKSRKKHGRTAKKG